MKVQSFHDAGLSPVRAYEGCAPYAPYSNTPDLGVAIIFPGYEVVFSPCDWQGGALVGVRALPGTVEVSVSRPSYGGGYITEVYQFEERVGVVFRPSGVSSSREPWGSCRHGPHCWPVAPIE